ncbi:MAG: AmmeMemoRadiSam system protein B [Candidatus Moranbacteria bacterium]|nr:AmmeMemoRadiSam system protein B [Candidatus Moranbacteria bacterium]
MLNYAAITPHPPIIIPGIGGKDNLEKVKATIDSLKILNKDFKKKNPDTIVIVSPHSKVDFNVFNLNLAEELVGDFSDFGLNRRIKFENDLDLASKIIKSSKDREIELNTHRSLLDHGVWVPLYYLTQDLNCKVINLSFCFKSLIEHYDFGRFLSEVFEKTGKKIAFVASGDLSHRLTPDAPAGFSQKGKEFDKKLIKFLKQKNKKGILNFDQNLIEEAGECGLRSIVILLGILDKKDYRVEVLSYEGPFGVGYLSARLEPV